MAEKKQETQGVPKPSEREAEMCRALMALFNEWRLAGRPMRAGSPPTATA